MSATLEMPAQRPAVRRRTRYAFGRVLLLANCLALAAVAVWFRCWKLENIPGVNGDEAWYGVQAVEALRGAGIAWRTPTGNVANPFFLGPLVLLHALFAPSFALLRSVAVASGLAALLLNFFLCRRVFGPRAATISTLLLAVLPIDLAYSRFAWDASQSLAATVLVLYLPLLALHEPSHRARWLAAGIVAFAAAVLVHPTNVFTAPLVGAAMFYAYRAEIGRCWARVRVKPHRIACAALVLAIGGAAWIAWARLGPTVVRLAHPGEAWAFFVNYGRLFSGGSVYRYIPGSIGGGGIDALDVATWALAATALVGFRRLLSCERYLPDRALAAGWLGSCLAFFLFAGAGSIAPHFERYGVCLIVSGALVLARGACWFCLGEAPARRLVEFSLAALAWSLLCGFYCNYFWFFERTGGLSHRTFHTAAAEPKQEALAYVLDRCAPHQPVRLLSGEWWNRWPLEYLATSHENVKVVSATDAALQVEFAGLCGAASPARWTGAASGRDECAWFIEFSGSEADAAVARRLAECGIEAGRKQIFDYAGRPLLTIYGPIPQRSPK